jgi:hypothetical protein
MKEFNQTSTVLTIATNIKLNDSCAPNINIIKVSLRNYSTAKESVLDREILFLEGIVTSIQGY